MHKASVERVYRSKVKGSMSITNVTIWNKAASVGSSSRSFQMITPYGHNRKENIT